MDGGSLINPRGPLPPGVYWRRRLALLGAVLLAFVVGVYSCTRDGATDTAKPAPTASRPAASATSAAPTATASAKPSVTPTRTPTANPGALCPDKALKVAATADAKRYAKGARPVLTLSVTNIGRVACTRDLGQAARELRLTSGTDRIWSSDDCSPGGGRDRVVLEPGTRRTFSVTWARRRSKPGCPAGQPVASAGAYRVVARLGHIEAPGTAFILT